MKKIKQLTFLAALSAGFQAYAQPGFDANVQIIHNCAAPIASQVDIYVNDQIFLNDFAFRSATEFTALPGGVTYDIDIAPASSTSSAEAIFSTTLTPMPGENYYVVARGVVGTGFAANPDGANTAFTLDVVSGARLTANVASNTDLYIFHNATDAPTVDVLARDVAALVEDVPYPGNGGYIEVPAADYLVDITPAGNPAVIVGTWTAPLSGLAGQSVAVLASGFLSSDNNNDGAAFGLIAVLTDGTVIELESTPTAFIQVIHNAADPAAASVDVYVNGAITIPDFAFRSATGYVPVPAGVELSIAVAPGTSSSVADALATFPVTLENGKNYVVFANGVLNPASFAANPDGIATAFSLYASDGQRKTAADPNNFEFRIFHGATDAPTVDAIANGALTIADNAAYTDLTDYISVPPASYTVDITPGNDNSTIVASYIAALSGTAGATGVVFASGFLAPANNQDGPAFGLWATLADGTTFPLDVNTSIATINANDELVVFPNPASDRIFINGLKDNASVSIVDLKGNVVVSEINTNEVSVEGLASGLYQVNVLQGNTLKSVRVAVK